MRYLILSDIHSNCEALTAVLAHVRRKHWDKAVVLGDIVGYGANPNQAVEMIRELKPLVAIRGNHDKVCAGVEDGEMFNRVALQAAMWTRQKLTPGNLRWLQSLPEGPAVVDGNFAVAHGTPIDEDAYIFGEIEALNVFRQTAFPLCFFGHSHFPVLFGLSPDAIQTVLTDTVAIGTSGAKPLATADLGPPWSHAFAQLRAALPWQYGSGVASARVVAVSPELKRKLREAALRVP